MAKIENDMTTKVIENKKQKINVLCNDLVFLFPRMLIISSPNDTLVHE